MGRRGGRIRASLGDEAADARIRIDGFARRLSRVHRREVSHVDRLPRRSRTRDLARRRSRRCRTVLVHANDRIVNASLLESPPLPDASVQGEARDAVWHCALSGGDRRRAAAVARRARLQRRTVDRDAARRPLRGAGTAGTPSRRHCRVFSAASMLTLNRKRSDVRA